MKKNTNESGRVSWLDIAKGFSIIFIVLGHASYGFLYEFCFAFNSVIFFILSGMSFCRIKNEKDDLLCFDNRKTGIFLKKTGEKLLLPYFVWGSVSIVIYLFLEGAVLSRLQPGRDGNFAILPNFAGLLYGNSGTGFLDYYRPLWFIPCLIVTELMWFFILKLMYRISVKKAWILYTGLMAGFCVFGVMESCLDRKLILPFEAESAIFMSFFFGIGLTLRRLGGGGISESCRTGKFRRLRLSYGRL